MAFYRELGQAPAGAELNQVVATWWAQAMLDTDPARHALYGAVENGTLPSVTMAAVFAQRRSNGGAIPGE